MLFIYKCLGLRRGGCRRDRSPEIERLSLEGFNLCGIASSERKLSAGRVSGSRLPGSGGQRASRRVKQPGLEPTEPAHRYSRGEPGSSGSGTESGLRVTRAPAAESGGRKIQQGVLKAEQ